MAPEKSPEEQKSRVRLPLEVKLISSPVSSWDRLVDIVKDLGVLFTAAFAVATFLPPEVKEPFAIWWGELRAPKPDIAGIEQVASNDEELAWFYAGNGSASDTSPPWVFGKVGSEIEIGDVLKPLTDVNIREARITGVNPSPSVLGVLDAQGDECLKVAQVDPSQRTSSVWLFGSLVDCSER